MASIVENDPERVMAESFTENPRLPSNGLSMESIVSIEIYGLPR
jgi:hypothetical protein